MPTEPEQINILEAVQTALLDIQAGATYFNSLTAANVHIGRATFDDSDELPFISILEVPIPPEQMRVSRGGGAILAGKWELFVQGFIRIPTAADNFPLRPAYRFKQDVVNRLLLERSKLDKVGQPEYLFGSKFIEDIEVGRGP